MSAKTDATLTSLLGLLDQARQRLDRAGRAWKRAGLELSLVRDDLGEIAGRVRRMRDGKKEEDADGDTGKAG
jgi:hypothetical protein